LRTKNLFMRKPESGFRGLAAVLPSFGLAFAVFAAAGMMAAGCDSLTGGGGETAFAEAAAPESAGGPAFAAADGIKAIKVKFDVKNGGWGLIKSYGVVSTQDDSHLNWGFGELANDFEVRIAVPAGEKYLNIRWEATDFFWKVTYLKARLQLGDGSGSYTVVLDYNGRGKVAVKNLSDVSLNTKDADNDFDNAYRRAGTTDPEGFRIIKVRFEVKNGEWGLWKSEGIVSTQDDSYLIYDDGDGANDFDITIPVPLEDEYLNVRWRSIPVAGNRTYVKAKMKAESGTITLDYNGPGKVVTKNLYDAVVGPYYGENNPAKDWADAKNRSVND